MVLPTVKIGSKKEMKSVRETPNLNAACLNLANWLATQRGERLDITAEPYKKKDGSLSEVFYTVSAKDAKGEQKWSTVRILTRIGGNDRFVKPKRYN